MAPKKLISVVASLVALCLVSSLEAQSATQSTAASVLFKQFETVGYTKTSFLVDSKTHAQDEAVHNVQDLLLPYGELMEELKLLSPDAESDFEKGYGAVFVGAKDFGGKVGLGPGAEGLGMTNSRKCYIGILEGGQEPNLDADFAKASKEVVNGVTIWKWTVPSQGGATHPVTSYAAQIAQTYFLTANNKSDFQDAMNALTLLEKAPVSSPAVPGWEKFSEYSYWIYRQIRWNEINSPTAAGLDDVTSDVTTLTFFADVGSGEGFIEVLSSGQKSNGGAPQILRRLGPEQFSQQASGVWQTTITLGKGGANDDTLLELFYRFGFGVAL